MCPVSVSLLRTVMVLHLLSGQAQAADGGSSWPKIFEALSNIKAVVIVLITGFFVGYLARCLLSLSIGAGSLQQL